MARNVLNKRLWRSLGPTAPALSWGHQPGGNLTREQGSQRPGRVGAAQGNGSALHQTPAEPLGAPGSAAPLPSDREQVQRVFCSGRAQTPGIEGTSSSWERDRHGHDTIFIPYLLMDSGAVGTRRSQHGADSEPRHRAVPGARIIPAWQLCLSAPHSLFAHASEAAPARHVLLCCSLSHLGHGMQNCSSATERGKGTRLSSHGSLAAARLGWAARPRSRLGHGVHLGT